MSDVRSAVEIAAGLSPKGRETMRMMRSGGGAIWMAEPVREELDAAGLLKIGPPAEAWHQASFRFTDLGQSVAAALTPSHA